MAMMEPYEHADLVVHDRELERRVRNFLFGYKMPALRNIDVRVFGDTVTLHGRVGCFYHKQLCLHCCHRVAGVRTVVDHIAVKQWKTGARVARTGVSAPLAPAVP